MSPVLVRRPENIRWEQRTMMLLVTFLVFSTSRAQYLCSNVFLSVHTLKKMHALHI